MKNNSYFEKLSNYIHSEKSIEDFISLYKIYYNIEPSEILIKDYKIQLNNIQYYNDD